MSHPYTDRYPNSGPTSEQRISALEQRIAKLEAQLGAAPRVAATREDAGATTSDANGSAAAPSVSAEQWVCSAETWAGLARAFRRNNYIHAPIACDLAAWVTEFMGSKDNLSMDEALKLCEGLWAFCRGEKLPEVK